MDILNMNNIKAGLYVALGFLVYKLVVKPLVDKVMP